MAVAKDPELVTHVITMSDELGKHLAELQKFSAQTTTVCSDTAALLMPAAMDDAAECRDLAARALELAAQFANKGMDLGFQFASRGMELGYEFASRGEEVGPMANRILFMATQVGVMADRIGEMSDRILFMANQIGEFGDRIVYVSQLVVYTEQLIINAGVLVTEVIRIIADLMLGLTALVADQEAYFQQRAAHAGATQTLPLIYDNMNLMLRNMHEYSLTALKNQARNREDELRVRELQVKLRENTLSANACFCPCFCIDQPGNDGPRPQARKTQE
ncbi:hypothetical protein HUS23_10320 [Ectothiorhodospiraceae bacterium 2226]|nr:hypothetical protein HUS23_10320 [Ectothiorhodospiraceae bacterium 2226]